MRLTKHLEKDSLFTCNEKIFIKCYKRLSEYEDILEKHGIDLVKLSESLEEARKAFDKLDHTCCMNSDKIQYGRDDCDCQNMDEMVDCLEVIEKLLFPTRKSSLKKL